MRRNEESGSRGSQGKVRWEIRGGENSGIVGEEVRGHEWKRCEGNKEKL